MEKNKKKNGFTLPELLIGLAIFILAFAVLNLFFSTGLSTFKYTMSQEHSMATGRTTFNELVDIVRYKPYEVLAPGTLNDPVAQMEYTDKDGVTTTIYVDSSTKSLKINKGGTVETFAAGVAKSIKFTKENSNQFNIELIFNDGGYVSSPDVVFKSLVQVSNI